MVYRKVCVSLILASALFCATSVLAQGTATTSSPQPNQPPPVNPNREAVGPVSSNGYVSTTGAERVRGDNAFFNFDLALNGNYGQEMQQIAQRLLQRWHRDVVRENWAGPGEQIGSGATARYRVPTYVPNRDAARPVINGQVRTEPGYLRRETNVVLNTATGMVKLMLRSHTQKAELVWVEMTPAQYREFTELLRRLRHLGARMHRYARLILLVGSELESPEDVIEEIEPDEAEHQSDGSNGSTDSQGGGN